MEAAASPFPRLETTPPVTNINLVMMGSPRSSVLLVGSPVRCQLQPTDARLQQRVYRNRFRWLEAVPVLRVFQAVRAPFGRTPEGIRHDKRTGPSAYDN